MSLPAESLTASRPTPVTSRPEILVVDDDPVVREAFRRTLADAGFAVTTAASGHDALAIARKRTFHLLLLDLRLPDMPGTEIVRILSREMPHVRFIIMSGFLTIPVTVEAMKLGALDVIPKPVSFDRLIDLVTSGLQGEDRPRPLRMGPPPHPKSAAERWALQVLKACEAEGDLKTLEDWATFSGVSYTSLREICSLANVPPHDGRDLARCLGAVMRARRLGCHVEVLLNVGDRRTLRMLLDKAGIPSGPDGVSIGVAAFLDRQRFVPQDNEGLRTLRRLLAVPHAVRPERPLQVARPRPR